MRGLVVMLVACGGKAPPSESAPIGNRATSTVSEPAQTECRPRGLVIDGALGEQAIGATVVFSGSVSEQVAISDEKGLFSIPIDAGHTRITAYYGDRSFEWAFLPSYCAARIRITLAPPNGVQAPIVPY